MMSKRMMSRMMDDDEQEDDEQDEDGQDEDELDEDEEDVNDGDNYISDENAGNDDYEDVAMVGGIRFDCGDVNDNKTCGTQLSNFKCSMNISYQQNNYNASNDAVYDKA